MPEVQSGAKELDMARSLIDAMTAENWEPEKYRDDYADALMKVIEEKIAAGRNELPPTAKRGAPPSTKVVDIVAMLQESLKQRGGKAAGESKTKARKRA